MQRNEHFLADANPTYVTGARFYRAPVTLLVEPGSPQHADLEAYLPPEHHQIGGYGIVLFDSEEHAMHYVGPVEQVRQFREHCDPSRLDTSQGVLVDQWPRARGDVWAEVIPFVPWNEGAVGIVTEFDHRDTTVVVYEYLAEVDGKQVPMVAFHCGYCHRVHGSEYEKENHGPVSRRWVAADARKHIRYAGRDGSDCRPINPEHAEVVTRVANDLHGTHHPVITAESRCATTGPCSTIRHLRVRAAAKP